MWLKVTCSVCACVQAFGVRRVCNICWYGDIGTVKYPGIMHTHMTYMNIDFKIECPYWSKAKTPLFHDNWEGLDVSYPHPRVFQMKVLTKIRFTPTDLRNHSIKNQITHWLQHLDVISFLKTWVSGPSNFNPFGDPPVTTTKKTHTLHDTYPIQTLVELLLM